MNSANCIQAQSVKMWKMGATNGCSADDPRRIHVKGADIGVMPDCYHLPELPNNLNGPALFKLNKYIRLAMSKRFDTIDDICDDKWPKPVCLDEQGREFELPGPYAKNPSNSGICQNGGLF